MTRTVAWPYAVIASVLVSGAAPTRADEPDPGDVAIASDPRLEA